ncbi:MAG: CRISPR-associated endonuclease Cas2 [Acidobacteriia bacterium]|nr:CRISPR-associated endonuclease Cas2 [Methyloceanibacter sp.]MCL6491364.1 CRISPR-associated endonuclease Cas2 [Terriglobia bacterium]
MSAPHYWLVGYDIASPRRLRRVHRYLKKRAFPVQYSLFLMRGTLRELERLLHDLAQLIHPRRDDVRAWPVPASTHVVTFGRGLAEDIVIVLRAPGAAAARTGPGRTRAGVAASTASGASRR